MKVKRDRDVSLTFSVTLEGAEEITAARALFGGNSTELTKQAIAQSSESGVNVDLADGLMRRLYNAVNEYWSV